MCRNELLQEVTTMKKKLQNMEEPFIFIFFLKACFGTNSKKLFFALFFSVLFVLKNFRTLRKIELTMPLEFSFQSVFQI